MTTNLITGKSGTPHVTSGDMGAIQAGLVGNDSYLLQNSDGTFPAITMQDANNALVPVLNLVLEGRYARVTETQTVTIESGVTGQNRNDLVCMKYTRDDKNIESMTLEVLKGTPAEGTAADPTVPDGSIHEGAGEAWIPLARIPISGITPGTPVMLVKQLPPMSRLWDSVTYGGLYMGATDENGFLQVNNPFHETHNVFAFCELSPNGMVDTAGKRFDAYFWNITNDQIRFRIRRGDKLDWVNDKQPVRVQWMAFKQLV